MTLTQDDLQAIGTLIDQRLSEQEKRIFRVMHHRFNLVDNRILQLEERFGQKLEQAVLEIGDYQSTI